MAPSSRWYFTREQLERSPSRRAGCDADKELSNRQQAANLLQEMGQRLNVSQLTINTAIVYMHRFYMVQSFTRFNRNSVAPAAIFLAAKVEEQPRKLEHVIKVAHACLSQQDTAPDVRSEAYLQQAQDLVILESIILQTLGFEITIDHPHTHVVKCTQLVRGPAASKDLAQTSYFMATNSLHLTTFSLQYTPPVVACVCIHLACKWSNWEIPVSTDGKPWWEYVDVTVTLKLLDELTHEFLQILEKTPNRLKRIRNWRIIQATKKPIEDGCEDDDNSLNEQTLLRMISRTGIMNSSPFSDSSSQPFPVTKTDAEISSAPWGAPPQNQREPHRTSEQSSSAEQSQLLGTKPVSLAKVSLKEYRAKHAEELAAQKRQLEHMGASLKEQYASAAQNLLMQQQREREREAHTSPIILKIPLHDVGHERQEKPTSLKLRLPVSSREKQDEGKIRVKVPVDESGGSSSKSRDKHRGSSSSSHHHHHHHHNNQSSRQHHQETSSGSSSKRSSTPQVGSSHKTSAPSRKRSSDDISGHEHASHKMSRTSKSLALDSPMAQSMHRSHASHSKPDKEPTGANGHNAPKTIDYQDTVNMLNSLLSAQGVPPIPPPQYLNQYGDYRRARSSNTDKAKPPPLPVEPPPPLPPLPK